MQLDVSVVNVALGALKVAFDTDLKGLEWVVNSYALTFSALLIGGGAFGDRFGARAVFVGGFVVFTVASVGCALADSMAMLVTQRCLQGVGAALLLPTSLTLIRISFHDPAARARAVATWGACGGLALAAGPVLGGLMIEHLGWRSVFLLNIPIGLLAVALIRRGAPPSPTTDKRIDAPGQLCSAASLAALTFALTEAGHRGWDRTTLLCLLAAAVFGALFVLVENKVADPMLPRRLARNRTLATTALCGAAINLTFYGTVFALSVYYQTILHYSAFRTGLAFVPLTAVLTVSTMASSRIAHRVGPTAIITTGFLVQCAGFLALSRLAPATSQWWLNGALVLVGVGSAMAVPSITNLMLAAVDKRDAGMASGLLASSRQVGGVVGVAVFGAFITSADVVPFTRGMSHAMLFAACIMLATAIVNLRASHRVAIPADPGAQPHP